jgi:hypothetical protein
MLFAELFVTEMCVVCSWPDIKQSLCNILCRGKRLQCTCMSHRLWISSCPLYLSLTADVDMLFCLHSTLQVNNLSMTGNYVRDIILFSDKNQDSIDSN